ncbi:hypothetical protein GOBAR_DD26546 [Gossypium barbadense]|nr:hypothetical protein GOBAR_DD26546 [Gossypium barbadense]
MARRAHRKADASRCCSRSLVLGQRRGLSGPRIIAEPAQTARILRPADTSATANTSRTTSWVTVSIPNCLELDRSAHAPPTRDFRSPTHAALNASIGPHLNVRRMPASHLESLSPLAPRTTGHSTHPIVKSQHLARAPHGNSDAGNLHEGEAAHRHSRKNHTEPKPVRDAQAVETPATTRFFTRLPSNTADQSRGPIELHQRVQNACFSAVRGWPKDLVTTAARPTGYKKL